MGKPAPFVITDADGGIIDRFTSEQERDEELLTGEYPDDSEPAFVNDWVWKDEEDFQNPPGVPDCGDPGPNCVEHDGACD